MTISNIPSPNNFNVVNISSNSVELKWDKASSEFHITYQVFVKKEKWENIYEGSETTCKCTNLESETRYKFMVFSSHNREISTERYCNAWTDKTWGGKALIVGKKIAVGTAIGTAVVVVGGSSAGVIFTTSVVTVGAIRLFKRITAGPKDTKILDSKEQNNEEQNKTN